MPQVVESRNTGGRGLKGTEVRIEITTYVDGVATAATGTPTFTVTRADGTVLVTAQNASVGTTGVYYYDLTPTQAARVDLLTVVLAGTWSGAAHTFTELVEIVGEHLFTLAAARAFDEGALTNSTTYTAAEIIEARDQITDRLAQWTGVSWVGRHARYNLPGTGTARLRVTHPSILSLIAASVDGTAQTVGDIDFPAFDPTLEHTTNIWTSPTSADPLNVIVEYEHGLRGRPKGVTRIALLLLRDELVKSPYPDQARSVAGEAGAVELIREGGPMKNITRIPEVNSWISSNRLIPVA